MPSGMVARSISWLKTMPSSTQPISGSDQLKSASKTTSITSAKASIQNTGCVSQRSKRSRRDDPALTSPSTWSRTSSSTAA